MNKAYVTLLMVTSLLVPVGMAGTPSSPEIQDAANDTADPALDVVSAWVTSTGDDVLVTIRVRDLSSPNPLVAGDYRYYYRVDFSLSHLANPLSLEGQVHLVDSKSAAGVKTNTLTATGYTVGAGTSVRASGVSGTVTDIVVDVGASTITMSLGRAATNGATLIPAGTVLSGMTVSTAAGESVVEAHPSTALAPYLGPGRTPADSTGVGAAYTIN